jgi:ketosteroid isomerase-like protein
LDRSWAQLPHFNLATQAVADISFPEHMNEMNISFLTFADPYKNIISMKALFYQFLFLIIVTIAVSCNQTSERLPDKEKPDMDQLKVEVQDMFNLSMEFFRNKDLEGLVNRFAEGGTLKLPGSPLLTGHEALHENYAGTLELEEFNLELWVTKIEVAESGDMAYALADFEVSFLTPLGPYSDRGNTLMVLVRQNGEWKIAAEYLSSGPGAD